MPRPFTSKSAAAASKSRTKGKGKGKPMGKVKDEAEVEVKDWSQQKRANQARTDGSIKKVNPSPCDVEARAEVVHRGACDKP